jgi:hypothetical protein
MAEKIALGKVAFSNGILNQPAFLLQLLATLPGD